MLNLIMGARNGAKTSREENDFYATNPKALDLFISTFDEKLNQNVWENACGAGHLSECLIKHGHNVLSTDLIDRGYDKMKTTLDFLNADPQEWHFDGDILTNPPFKYAMDFVRKGLDLVNTGNRVIMFLKIQFLESEKRYNGLFKDNPPKYVYVHTTRQETCRGGDFETYKDSSGSMCFAWFVWEKGYKGDTVLRWI